MFRIDDGGPAYPRPASIDTSSGTLSDGDTVVREQQGMSLRDVFAAAAITGILASDALTRACVQVGGAEKRKPSAVAAETAYQYADAMLVVRTAKPAV